MYIRKLLSSISLNVLVTGILFWIPVGIFLKIAGELIEKEPFPFDVPILEALHSIANPFFDALFITMTTVGGVLGVITISIGIAYLFFNRRRYTDLLFYLASVGGATITNAILKAAFHRDRPSLWNQVLVEHSFSFPSGHAMASAAIATCFTLMYWHTPKRWLVLTLGIIGVVLISTSRLYFGVHYPSDIIAGWSVSIVWVLVVYYVITRLRNRHKIAISAQPSV